MQEKKLLIDLLINAAKNEHCEICNQMNWNCTVPMDKSKYETDLTYEPDFSKCKIEEKIKNTLLNK